MLLAKPIAVATDGDDVTVMQQAIEDGCRRDRIAEDAAPLADGPIAGDQHGATLLASGNRGRSEIFVIALEPLGAVYRGRRIRIRAAALAQTNRLTTVRYGVESLAFLLIRAPPIHRSTI